MNELIETVAQCKDGLFFVSVFNFNLPITVVGV